MVDASEHNTSESEVQKAPSLFINRTVSLYQALHGLLSYFKSEKEDVLSLVTPCLTWVSQVRRAMLQVVVSMDLVTKCTVQELSHLNPNQLPAIFKAELKATARNLNLLSESRHLAKKKIDECEELANQAVFWHGARQKMQHALMKVVSKFCSGSECEAAVAELEEKHIAWSSAKADVCESGDKVARLRMEMNNLHSHYQVYQSIALCKSSEGTDRNCNAHHEGLCAQSRLAEVEFDLEEALQESVLAGDVLTIAEMEYMQLQDRFLNLCHNFGSFDLGQLAALQSRIQQIPELLGAMAMKEQSIFAFLKGQIASHEMLCNRFFQFVSFQDDHEPADLLKALQPQICEAISKAEIFEPLKEQIAGQMQVELCPIVGRVEERNIPTPSRAAGSAPVPTARQPLLVSLADEDEEEDVF